MPNTIKRGTAGKAVAVELGMQAPDRLDLRG
jgi:hypothetical protein